MNESTAREESSSTVDQTKKLRFCAKCRNHNKKKTVKGHKKICEFRWCYCAKCVLTNKKREVTAQQVQLRREQQEEERARMEEERANNGGTSASDGMLSYSDRLNPSIDSEKSNAVPESSRDLERRRGSDGLVGRQSQKVAWDSIKALCNEFKYRQESYPLLHVILKFVASNLEDARSKIEEATKEVEQCPSPVREEPVRPRLTQLPWKFYPSSHSGPGPELQTPAALYKFPPIPYPRTVPLSFHHFPLFQAAHFGLTHTVPSAYTIPCHEETHGREQLEDSIPTPVHTPESRGREQMEDSIPTPVHTPPSRPSILNYDDFPKVDHKPSSLCKLPHHPEGEMQFSPVEI